MANKTATEFSKELNKLVSFKDDSDRIEFKVELLQLEIMDQVKKMMVIRNLSKIDLANYLQITEDQVTELFTVDKLLDFKMVVKIWSILNCHLAFKLYD